MDDSLEGGGGVTREQSSGGQKVDLGLSGDESLRGCSKASLTTGGPNLDLDCTTHQEMTWRFDTKTYLDNSQRVGCSGRDGTCLSW